MKQLQDEPCGMELFSGLRCPITMRLRFGLALSALAATLSLSSSAQVSPAAHGPQTTVALHPDLLPAAGFADWKATTAAPAVAEPAFSLVNANKAALGECNPQRSAVEDYVGPGGKTMHVEAVEFKDASGALAAYSIVLQPGMREIKGLGTLAAVGGGGVLFTTGAALVAAFPATLATSPATLADLPTLRSLAEVMPTAIGSQALQPLLPSLLPTRGLVAGSVRYATGTRSYMAEGGVLPAAGLGWEKEAEAVTAKYADKRGAETLTLLLYPTPPIAGAHQRAIDALIAGLGPSFAKSRTRREGSLVAVANGTFSTDAAQALVENAHHRQIASTDKAMVTPDVVETRKTFGMLANVILFSGFLGLAALALAIFFGGGRALIRILRGKPPATEAEFLSLHLNPQNPMPIFSKD